MSKTKEQQAREAKPSTTIPPWARRERRAPGAMVAKRKVDFTTRLTREEELSAIAKFVKKKSNVTRGPKPAYQRVKGENGPRSPFFD